MTAQNTSSLPLQQSLLRLLNLLNLHKRHHRPKYQSPLCPRRWPPLLAGRLQLERPRRLEILADSSRPKANLSKVNLLVNLPVNRLVNLLVNLLVNPTILQANLLPANLLQANLLQANLLQANLLQANLPKSRRSPRHSAGIRARDL